MIVTREREGVRLVAYRKAAHTSITNTFLTDRGEDVVRGQKQGRGRDQRSAAITVTFFRNPLARLVSAWNHLLCGDDPRSSLDRFGYTHRMKFDKFLELTLSIPDTEIDLHLASQSYQLCLALEKHHPDVIWVGQLENLATTSWREMRDFTGLVLPDFVPRFNAKGYKPWPTYYTEALAHRALQARFFDDYRTWQSRLWQ